MYTSIIIKSLSEKTHQAFKYEESVIIVIFPIINMTIYFFSMIPRDVCIVYCKILNN